MIQFVKNLYAYRELLYALTVSGIRAKYKQSILGVGWAVLQPLALTFISLIVFSKFAKISSGNIPYPLFAYVALLPWTLLSTSLSFAIPSLVTNMSLLRKIYFPREIFIISAILAALFDYLIASFIFLGMLVYYGVGVEITILYYPLILILQLALMTGVSLIGAIANVAFRDVNKSLPVLLQIWMLASPIVYPLSLVPERYQYLYLLNPMVGIIESYRNIFLEYTAPNAAKLGIAVLITTLIFSLGIATFRKGEKIIADII